ncbi:hypothetical protein [Streptomyces griseorubiginosus]|uniref:hypothetical protein n=1 Tax=Streptomyces griseorubiginosus TaxID=67304 RepID=UPI0033F86983
MTEGTDRVDAFLDFLDEAAQDARGREAACLAWLNEAGPQVAAELTQELIPADLRAAGVRFDWAARR